MSEWRTNSASARMCPQRLGGPASVRGGGRTRVFPLTLVLPPPEVPTCPFSYRRAVTSFNGKVGSRNSVLGRAVPALGERSLIERATSCNFGCYASSDACLTVEETE